MPKAETCSYTLGSKYKHTATIKLRCVRQEHTLHSNYCRVGHSTDHNTAHVHCVLDT